ncbi:formate dehydrogenase accessory protein FdhE [Pelomonas sp. CA6]|uniref:formate dehydrogenase accessory protein FdhE n=1 Tax=Pelomonas sp. CA6 TaxID=2907999 RepID=UPI001F4B9FD5|nr:formate dehydrogenase accessory protein FdhE [Pelomonas sp. CA6]MCH7342416.1 formate dehydrogenase accessory protein FdhE [Pelomonas sp. CA6]
MSSSANPRLMSPEEIAMRAGETPQTLRLPEAGLFAERELRLRQLASDHAMRDFLLFCAELAHQQHELLKTLPALALPGADAIEQAALHGRAPLPAALLPRNAVWRELLGRLLQGLAHAAIPAPARQLVQQLQSADADYLEQQADRLLSERSDGLDLAAAPLIAAALQVYWTGLVMQVQAGHGQGSGRVLTPFGLVDDATRCPCCASRPVASIYRLSAEGGGQRYLACSLCGTQWHYVRIKCARCQGTKGISFQSLLRDDGEPLNTAQKAVQAECCESCGHYLKVVAMDKDLQVEPLADDLATLTLDMLVAELGLARHGLNPMLIFGEADEAGAPDGAPPDPGGH